MCIVFHVLPRALGASVFLLSALLTLGSMSIASATPQVSSVHAFAVLSTSAPYANCDGYEPNAPLAGFRTAERGVHLGRNGDRGK